jgi:peptidoglycan-associated lipoprotein
MNRLNKFTLAVLIATSFALAGCPKKPTVKANDSAGQTVAQTTDSGANTGRASGSDAGGVRPLTTTKGGEGLTGDGELGATIRFEYDSSEIKAEYQPIISAEAKQLAANRRLQLRLEGNTDERGSAEYNIALGERRAQAVKKALVLLGASESQLTTVSFGEERPVADGHDEAAWSQNRRVDIVVTGR